ncbi:MAG: hypothetical protein L3K15_05340 [Thermoplasmata archaeon]|nr:hypothetical protein [Thermoplasmata archaeon]
MRCEQTTFTGLLALAVLGILILSGSPNAGPAGGPSVGAPLHLVPAGQHPPPVVAKPTKGAKAPSPTTGLLGSSVAELRRAAPHPNPPGLVRGPSYSGHYYQGVEYSGTNQTVSKVAVTLQVPSDNPESTDFYYVILSLWDDAMSYDQIGITNDYGVWGLAYSYTTACAGFYYYNPAVISLDPGATYTFSMSIAAGNVTFVGLNATAAVVWNATFYTGGNNFYETGMVSCSGFSAYAYTDYEEIYTTNAPEPPYNFVFTHNRVAGAEVNAWSNFSVNSTQPINVAISPNQVAIENLPYSVASAGPNSFVVERTAAPTFLNASIALGRVYGTGRSVQVSAYYLPPSWVASFTPNRGTTPFASRLSLELAPGSPVGIDTLGLVANDSTGAYARSSITVDLLPHVLVTLRTNSSRTNADVGQSVAFRATATGGLGPYAFAWSQLPGGCAPPSGNVVACALNQTGTFPVSINVTDGLGYSNVSSLAFLVAPDPVLTIVSVFPASGRLDVGQRLFVNTTVGGGSGGIGYSWNGIAECPGGTGPAFVCTVTTTGTSNLSLRVSDATGTGASFALTINVSSDPVVSVPLLGRSHVDVGQRTTIAVSVGGGSGGELLQWQGLPPGCGGSTTSMDCAPNLPGNYSIYASVVDSNHVLVTSGRVKLTVSLPPTVSLLPTSSTVLVGDPLAIDASPSGGYGALAFSWSGLPPGCPAPSGAALSCTPNGTGSFPLTVRVSDANGGSANASTVVLVQPAPAGSPRGPPSSSLLPEVAAAAIVLAAAGAVLVVYRRRRRSGHDGVGRPNDSGEEAAPSPSAGAVSDDADANP